MKFVALRAAFGTTDGVFEVCVSAKIDEETSLDLSIATNHYSILDAETPSHFMREGVANSTE